MIGHLARPQFESLRIASNPERQLKSKWRLVRCLYEVGYDAKQLRDLIQTIDRMLQLRSDLDGLLDVGPERLDGEKHMAFISSMERTWEARGVARSVLKFLSRGCGLLPMDLQSRIEQLPLEELEELADQAADLKSITAIEEWLSRRNAISQ